MDELIHSAAGAFIGWALPQRREGPSAAPLVIAGALLPDADIFIEPFLDPQSGFVHRGFTHSLFGVAVLAPVAALVVLLLFRTKRYARLVALITIGMLSHLFLDLPTPMGAKLFYPFSNKYVHLDFLSYLDWTLFTLALIVLLATWTYANRDTAVRRGILSAVLLSSLSWWLFSEWPTQAFSFAATVEEATEQPLRTVYPLFLGGALLGLFVALARKDWGFRQNRAVFGRIGIGALSIYLVFCVAAQGIIIGRTEKFTRERGIVVWRRAASRMGYSSLVGPLRWTGLVLAPEGVYLAQVNLFSTRSPTFAFFPSATENSFVTRSRSIPEVQRFMEAARFPVTRYREEKGQHIVEYQEYGLSWRPLLRAILNQRREVLAVGWIEH
jgi:membrane-bound metal-dependent hydrolase YbcI (DUF457 family)